MKTWQLWVGFGLSVLGVLYCFFGVLMVGSFAAGPNYSQARLVYNDTIWTTGTFLFAAVTLLFGLLIVRNYIRQKRK